MNRIMTMGFRFLVSCFLVYIFNFFLSLLNQPSDVLVAVGLIAIVTELVLTVWWIRSWFHVILKSDLDNSQKEV